MIAALLFDLDGTLVETDDLHAEVFAEMGREHGVEIDRARYDAEIQGRMNAAIFADLFPASDSEALSQEKEARFRERLGETAAPVDGLVGLLDWARSRDLPIAVVTNAPRENADAMLGAIGLADRFGCIVVSDELPRGKPDPLPYATACARLGATPATALAFEDSRSGVRSAVAAGVPVIGLTSSLDAGALLAAGAVTTIRDFTDTALWSYLAEKDFA